MSEGERIYLATLVDSAAKRVREARQSADTWQRVQRSATLSCSLRERGEEKEEDGQERKRRPKEEALRLKTEPERPSEESDKGNLCTARPFAYLRL